MGRCAGFRFGARRRRGIGRPRCGSVANGSLKGVDRECSVECICGLAVVVHFIKKVTEICGSNNTLSIQIVRSYLSRLWNREKTPTRPKATGSRGRLETTLSFLCEASPER